MSGNAMLTPERWIWPGSRLVHVVDGDTIDVQLTIDIGFRRSTTGPQRVRLNRVDAWKGSTDKGRAATAYVLQCLAGQAFTVETVKPYKYGGEYMAEVVLPGGVNLSDLLVNHGHALPYDGRGPRPTEQEQNR